MPPTGPHLARPAVQWRRRRKGPEFITTEDVKKFYGSKPDVEDVRYPSFMITDSLDIPELGLVTLRASTPDAFLVISPLCLSYGVKFDLWIETDEHRVQLQQSVLAPPSPERT